MAKQHSTFTQSLVLAFVVCIGAFASGAYAQLIADAAAKNEDLSTLLAAIAASTEPLLSDDPRPAGELLIDPELELTVFAPTNDAFTAALEQLGISAEDLLADQAKLAKILKYHVAVGKVMA